MIDGIRWLWTTTLSPTQVAGVVLIVAALVAAVYAYIDGCRTPERCAFVPPPEMAESIALGRARLEVASQVHTRKDRQ